MTRVQQFLNELDKVIQFPYGSNCRVGKVYSKGCTPGIICKPIEGSIATECELCEKY